MKKLYPLIALIGLSLLAIGAFAQAPANNKPVQVEKPITTTHFAKAIHGSAKKPMASLNALIDYAAGDIALNPSATFYSWSPYLVLNAAYTIADSGTVSNYRSNVAGVAFDSVWDFYTKGFITPITAGSVSVDTIISFIHYHNTSATNDTIIFKICAVDVNGYPMVGTVYGADTAVIAPGFFAYNVLDSIQPLEIIKTTAIPSSARHGYNFSVLATVHGSKSDTIGVVYYSQGVNNCASLGGYYTPKATSIGVNDKAQRNVNSFVQGLYYQNCKGQHGTNTAMLWPLTSGTNQGMCINGGGYYISPLPLALIYPTCTGDTNWFDVQDIAIFPSISYSTILTGVNAAVDGGFEVAQNFPNPFNKSTEIKYSLIASSNVEFSVYDMTGRKIIENNYSNAAAGQHIITLAANQFTPGIYFYTFKVNGNSVTKKMVITE